MVRLKLFLSLFIFIFFYGAVFAVLKNLSVLSLCFRLTSCPPKYGDKMTMCS